MADQKRWFKVWTSITSDDDFDPSRPGGLMGLGRFAILGAYTALHGEKGRLEIMPDTLFRLTNSANINELQCDLALKNISFEEGKNRYGKIAVTWAKWQTYQEDTTAKERMKTLRAKRRGEEIRKEEKRGDIITQDSYSSSTGNGIAPHQRNPWPSVESFVELYNLNKPSECPTVRDITKARKGKYAAYLKQFPTVEFWDTVLNELNASAFLRGLKEGTPEHPARAMGLDWLCQKGKDGVENCQKTYEGKYRSPQRTQSYFDPSQYDDDPNSPLRFDPEIEE